MSLFEFPFRVLPDSGDEYTVTADTRDLTEWENWPGTLPGKVQRDVRAITDRMLITAIMEIAYVASKREEKWSGNFDAFRKQCRVDMIEQNGESETDPTQ